MKSALIALQLLSKWLAKGTKMVAIKNSYLLRKPDKFKERSLYFDSFNGGF